MFRQYRLKDYNFRLVLWLSVLAILGGFLVVSADGSLRNKEFAGIIAGIALMVIVSLFDFSWIMQFYWIFYVLNILKTQP